MKQFITWNNYYCLLVAGRANTVVYRNIKHLEKKTWYIVVALWYRNMHSALQMNSWTQKTQQLPFLHCVSEFQWFYWTKWLKAWTAISMVLLVICSTELNQTWPQSFFLCIKFTWSFTGRLSWQHVCWSVFPKHMDIFFYVQMNGFRSGEVKCNEGRREVAKIVFHLLDSKNEM